MPVITTTAKAHYSGELTLGDLRELVGGLSEWSEDSPVAISVSHDQRGETVTSTGFTITLLQTEYAANTYINPRGPNA